MNLDSYLNYLNIKINYLTGEKNKTCVKWIIDKYEYQIALLEEMKKESSQLEDGMELGNYINYLNIKINKIDWEKRETCVKWIIDKYECQISLLEEMKKESSQLVD